MTIDLSDHYVVRAENNGGTHQFDVEVGPSRGSSSRLELFFRLEVNKLKARAWSSLKSQSSDELFCRL